MSPRYAWPQFRYALELSLTLQSPAPTPENVDVENRRFRLDRVSDWTSAKFDADLITTEAVPDGIGVLEAYLLVSSPRSNTRIPVPLTKDPSSTHFVGELELERSILAGPVTVAGEVVAHGDWGVRAAGTSAPWIIVVDSSDAPVPPGAPPFDITWIEFDSDEAPSLVQAARSAYSVMDTSGPKPVLYLNRSVDGLEAILSAPRPRDEKKRLRDILGSQVAHYAATTLFNEALVQCDVTDDVVTRPGDPILTQMLEAVASEVESVQDVDELVVELSSEGMLRHELRAKVDTALMNLTHFSDNVARSVEAAFRG